MSWTVFAIFVFLFPQNSELWRDCIEMDTKLLWNELIIHVTELQNIRIAFFCIEDWSVLSLFSALKKTEKRTICSFHFFRLILYISSFFAFPLENGWIILNQSRKIEHRKTEMRVWYTKIQSTLFIKYTKQNRHKRLWNKNSRLTHTIWTKQNGSKNARMCLCLYVLTSSHSHLQTHTNYGNGRQNGWIRKYDEKPQQMKTKNLQRHQVFWLW